MPGYLKFILIPLVALIAVMVLSVSGCSEETATTTPGPQATATDGTPPATLSEAELKQVITDAGQALENAGTYSFKLDMTVDTVISGGTEAGTAVVGMNAAGQLDNATGQMLLTIHVLVDAPGVPESSQDVTTDVYVLADYIYLKMDVPGLGEQWMKAPRTEDMLEAFDINMMEKQLAVLDSPNEIGLEGYESIDGSSYYVIRLVPNTQKLSEFAEGLQLTGPGIDLETVAEIAEIFKEISYTTWVARDTKLIQKMEGSLLMEMTAEQAGASAGDFEKITMDITMNMEFYDYGAPVSIVLPEGAENAIEMPQ